MPDLRARALALLARREHTRAELQRKLAGLADADDDLASLLDELESERLLSDARYAAQRVAHRASRLGDTRLRQELKGAGVAEAAIVNALTESGDEHARCREVWKKKFGEMPIDVNERHRQMRFLQYRGFSTESIRKVLGGSEE